MYVCTRSMYNLPCFVVEDPFFKLLYLWNINSKEKEINECVIPRSALALWCAVTVAVDVDVDVALAVVFGNWSAILINAYAAL